MINDELLLQINNMPAWVRKATMLYYENGFISNDDIKNLANMCLVDNEQIKVSGINLISHETTEGFAISSINSIKGVNAIDTDKPIIFNKEGITVIYGLNGSGKSGYIRTFKKISGAKYSEDIKPNIYSNKRVLPMVSLTVAKGDGVEESFECNLRNPVEYDIFRTLDIFDTKISNAYINEAKEANYEPWIFSLLIKLVETASVIKKELESRIKQNNSIMLDFDEKYSSTESYLKFKKITYKTNIKSFEEEWTKEKQERLLELKKNDQNEKIVSHVKECEQKKKNLDLVIKYFENLDEYFEDTNWNSLFEGKQRWIKAVEIRKKSDLLFSDKVNGLDKQEVELVSWKKLWQYAREYYDEISNNRNIKSFAEVGSTCPLCNQTIRDEEVSSRMKNIDLYVNSKTIEEEEKAKKDYLELIKRFPSLKTKEELSTMVELSGLSSFCDVINEIHDKVIEFSKMLKNDLYETKLQRVDTKDAMKTLSNYKNELDNELNELNSLLNDEKQIKLKNELLNLEAEKFLIVNKETVFKYIESLKEIHKLEKGIKLTSTNKITALSKKLAEELITNDYICRFEKELKDLTKNNIVVSLKQQKAGKGKVPYKVVLSDVDGNQINPQEVLSEGENRVTALAAFFAEASGRKVKSPLIVDDPISSLDYTYEAKVIDRLVDAAKKRQVIVFTHRISMVVGISDKCKIENIDFKEIALNYDKNRKGVPTENSYISGKVKTQINVLIDNKLKKLKDLDPFSDEYQTLFRNICQEFRNIVEKSVEDVLINGVVKRFRKDIQTKNKLEKLSNISYEDCKLIDDYMTKYSYYDHSMSDETPLINMAIDELEDDLKTLKEWAEKKAKQ